MKKYKLIGSPKQIIWAEKILAKNPLTSAQLSALNRWAGPTRAAAGEIQCFLIIENRDKLALYADSLIKFLECSPEEKKRIAESVVNNMRSLIKEKIG